MATTFASEQERNLAFASELILIDSMLPAALEWIADNMEPGDVFDAEKLEAWAKARGYLKGADPNAT